MKLPIYELKINESLNDDSEITFVSLVDSPAIKKNFLAFNEQFIEPNKGEHEDEFIQRCVKYVIDEGKDQEQAVAICYSLWENHFAMDSNNNTTIDNSFNTSDRKTISQKFQIVNEEQRIISGALMIPDELIYRSNETFGEHYVKFSAETIRQIAIKFSKRKYQNNVNLMHDPNQEVDGVTMFESFITDKSRGIMPMKGFEDVPDGSWFGSYYVENTSVWESIKNGEYKGFSVEGLFDYNQPISQEQEALNRIGRLLNEIN